MFSPDRMKDVAFRQLSIEDLGPKVDRSSQGPVSVPSKTWSQLEAIRCRIKLLKEPGLGTRAFDAQKLLECNYKLMISAERSGSTDHAVTPNIKEYNTGSSQHTSIDSKANLIDLINIQRMSLGKSGVVFMHERMTPVKTEDRSTNVLIT